MLQETLESIGAPCESHWHAEQFELTKMRTKSGVILAILLQWDLVKPADISLVEKNALPSNAWNISSID